MSWLSEMWSSDSPATTLPPATPEQQQQYFDQIKVVNPTYYNQVLKFSDPKWKAEQQAASVTGAASGPAVAAPVGGSALALQSLNDSLGSGFESRYLPDSVDDSAVASTVSGQRDKANAYIANMLKRGTLTEAGRGTAVKALDTQTPNVRSRIQQLSDTILAGGRNQLTDIANTGRQTAAGTPEGSVFDPSGVLGQLSNTSSAFSSGYGSKLASSLPAGVDYFDTSGIGASGVTRPNNVSVDPYAVEGGNLNTGLDDDSASSSPKKQRRTTVF